MREKNAEIEKERDNLLQENVAIKNEARKLKGELEIKTDELDNAIRRISKDNVDKKTQQEKDELEKEKEELWQKSQSQESAMRQLSTDLNLKAEEIDYLEKNVANIKEKLQKQIAQSETLI